MRREEEERKEGREGNMREDVQDVTRRQHRGLCKIVRHILPQSMPKMYRMWPQSWWKHTNNAWTYEWRPYFWPGRSEAFLQVLFCQEIQNICFEHCRDCHNHSSGRRNVIVGLWLEVVGSSFLLMYLTSLFIHTIKYMINIWRWTYCHSPTQLNST